MDGGYLLQTFLMVGRQVLILFLLMSVGVASNRMKLVDEKVIKGMTNIVLYFVTPCVIVESFQRTMNQKLIRGLIFTAAAAVACHLIAILLGKLVLHDEDRSKEIVLRFGVIFGNCGFMSLPIEQALLGEDGVFYGAVFIAVFNIVLWTYGLKTMSEGQERITAKKLILNPGIIGIILGVLVFALQITLPDIIETPVESMAALNTPLPMVIIGYYLGNLRPADLLHDKKQYISMLFRLVVVPVITIALLLPFHVDKTVLLVCAIASCAPTAATTSMFAAKYGRNARLAAQMVSVSTLFSLVTMPLIITAAELLA